MNDAIATYLVIPNRIDVPIATLETNALHFRLPEGVVRVTVIEAQNLHNMDSGFLLQGKSDPYARVKVGSEEHKAWIRNTLSTRKFLGHKFNYRSITNRHF